MILSIVIPVYNEVNTLIEILKIVKKAKVPSRVKKELIVVDDYSTDGTRELLKKIKDKSIKVFYHDKNQGKGAALKTGFTKCTGDIVIIQDADMEYNPDEYPRLIQPIIDGKADVVYGSRFAGGETHRVLYFWHSVMNKFLTLLSNMFTDLNLTDMETCYKVFRREIIQNIDIEEKRFGFEPEVTAKLAEQSRKENIRIYEVGISYFGRTYEEGKKIGIKDAFRALWCIFKYNTSNIANLVKYFFNGLIVAFSQFITIFSLVEYAGFGISDLYKNIAYAASIEVSILVGFILHAKITWRYKFRSFGSILGRFFLFQLVTSFSFVVRQVVFYYFNLTGIDYKLNTLIGIAIAIILNFISYQKIVFRRKKNEIDGKGQK
ncbi:MAG: bifunctional glycosyltransferase family 2/GtrA family protein [Spirochaetales bacterium]|nr:bifunctional glycosyltransferase family 2/GtrA family protein [Spirochaetales bacterium]